MKFKLRNILLVLKTIALFSTFLFIFEGHPIWASMCLVAVILGLQGDSYLDALRE